MNKVKIQMPKSLLTVYITSICLFGLITAVAIRNGWDTPPVAIGKFISYTTLATGLLFLPTVYQISRQKNQGEI